LKDRIFIVEELSHFDTYEDAELNKIIVDHYRYYNKLLLNALKAVHKRTKDPNAKTFCEKVLDSCNSEWKKQK